MFRHHFGPELWKRSLDMTGIKGMILLACGPAFTQLPHFEKIKSLVSRYDAHPPSSFLMTLWIQQAPAVHHRIHCSFRSTLRGHALHVTDDRGGLHSPKARSAGP